MSAFPPSFPGQGGAADASPVARQWAALGEAAGAVALLAAAEPATPAGMRDFPIRIREAGGWRLRRAEDELADLAAIMQHGLAALLSVNARGADPRPAARALLAEFDFACGALLALLPARPEPVVAA